MMNEEVNERDILEGIGDERELRGRSTRKRDMWTYVLRQITKQHLDAIYIRRTRRLKERRSEKEFCRFYSIVDIARRCQTI